MASINGICIKDIVQFRGHEGEPLAQGDLYLNDKKIGFWSQDSWGGPDNVILNAGYNQRLLNNAIVALNPDKTETIGAKEEAFTIPYDLDLLVFDYLSLAEDEEAFISAKKEGYSGILVASDGLHQTTWNLSELYTKMSDADLLQKMEPLIANAKKSFMKEDRFTKHTIKIFRSASDFVIGEPIKEEDITQKKTLNKMISNAASASSQSQVDNPDKSYLSKSPDIER